jgi:hypothetical protein
VKYWRPIFHAQVGPDGFYIKCVRTHYAELVIFHPMGYAGHVMHSGEFGV